MPDHAGNSFLEHCALEHHMQLLLMAGRAAIFCLLLSLYKCSWDPWMEIPAGAGGTCLAQIKKLKSNVRPYYDVVLGGEVSVPLKKNPKQNLELVAPQVEI